MKKANKIRATIMLYLSIGILSLALPLAGKTQDHPPQIVLRISKKKAKKPLLKEKILSIVKKVIPSLMMLGGTFILCCLVVFLVTKYLAKDLKEYHSSLKKAKEKYKKGCEDEKEQCTRLLNQMKEEYNQLTNQRAAIRFSSLYVSTNAEQGWSNIVEIADQQCNNYCTQANDKTRSLEKAYKKNKKLLKKEYKKAKQKANEKLDKAIKAMFILPLPSFPLTLGYL